MYKYISVFATNSFRMHLILLFAQNFNLKPPSLYNWGAKAFSFRLKCLRWKSLETAIWFFVNYCIFIGLKEKLTIKNQFHFNFDFCSSTYWVVPSLKRQKAQSSKLRNFVSHRVLSTNQSSIESPKIWIKYVWSHKYHAKQFADKF